jgi:hypothetical protein
MYEGKIIFRIVNVDLLKNAELVSWFWPASSSEMTGYWNDEEFHAENQIRLWYMPGDKEDFGKELALVIRDNLLIKTGSDMRLQFHPYGE